MFQDHGRVEENPFRVILLLPTMSFTSLQPCFESHRLQTFVSNNAS